MKKIITTLIALGSIAGVANAGDWGKSPVIDSKAPIDLGCPCYDAGFEFSGFVAGIITDDETDIGGGASVAYFLSQDLGVELSYSALNTDPSLEHLVTANLVYRLVNADACIAPYILAGGGVLTNGSTHGVLDLGVGLDIRFEDWGCVGMFADATYNWVDGDEKEDFTLVRVGFRVPF